MQDNDLRLNQPGKPNRGTSIAAAKRASHRLRGTLHVAGRPGETIEMSDGRLYVVAADGSFRRQKAAKTTPKWLELKLAKAQLKKAA